LKKRLNTGDIHPIYSCGIGFTGTKESAKHHFPPKTAPNLESAESQKDYEKTLHHTPDISHQSGYEVFSLISG
jgi:hypothetical protein